MRNNENTLEQDYYVNEFVLEYGMDDRA